MTRPGNHAAPFQKASTGSPTKSGGRTGRGGSAWPAQSRSKSAASRAALSHYRVESAAVRRTARLNTPNTARLYAHEAFGWTDAPAGAVPLSPTLSPTLPRPPSTPWGTRSSPTLSSRYE